MKWPSKVIPGPDTMSLYFFHAQPIVLQPLSI